MTVLRGAGPVGPDDGYGSGYGSGSGSPGSDGSDGSRATTARAAGGGYDTRWLNLRADADGRSRSAELLGQLLAGRRPGSRADVAAARPAHLLDLGCGTGAMQRWCADRLPAGIRWSLLDPDPELLAVAAQRAVRPVRRVTGTATDLTPGVLADVDAVVCSALLDVLPGDEIDVLVGVLVDAGVPLLASMTVTGRVRLSPSHHDDEQAGAAVHRTATAGGSAGPEALTVLRTAAARRAAAVVERATPWLLVPARDDALLQAWTAGYVAAALAGADGGREGNALTGWAEDRRERVAVGGLDVTVEHSDVLVLPA